MNNRDRQIIKKILFEIDIIEDLIKGLKLESFSVDERTKRACCMTLINIGELVKNLTDEFKENFNYIPWKAIAGMRDITAHKYQTLKMGDVWVTIEKEIPNLKVELNKIIMGK
ncbi:MAG: antitoxin [Clostridiaceae bacterium BRH_c20a]|nr:MAG: antitoxin [Clostridiaceae bacterium BRH_c20a]